MSKLRAVGTHCVDSKLIRSAKMDDAFKKGVRLGPAFEQHLVQAESKQPAATSQNTPAAL